jgi:DNA mismatch repair ATPase MutS
MVESGELKILGGRHPVVEKMEKNFISNDLNLNKKEYVHIIT